MKKIIIPVFAALSVISYSHQAFADIHFKCEQKDQLNALKKDLEFELQRLKISTDWLVMSTTAKDLSITLKTPESDTNTLDLYIRSEYGIKDDVVYLPVSQDRYRAVSTVSQKEIFLALAQHGRKTEFSSERCHISNLIQTIGVRQNIVAWAEKLAWVWPDGGPAFWNKKFWIKGTPVKGVKLTDAFNDMFFNQKKYSIGCYTASKMVYAHAVLDYFNRVNPNLELLKKVEEKLLFGDGEPLVDIEPDDMWSFEADFNPNKDKHEGKILTMMRGVAPKNFVPGDWNYILNTDKKTYEKTGYEGSNAIYLGKNRFDDYYADREKGHYTYEEKMFEVYQWRNGVFSASRHKHKIKPIPDDVKSKMDLTPDKGGQVLDFRTYPKLF